VGRPASGKGSVSSSRMWCRLEERPGEGVLAKLGSGKRKRERRNHCHENTIDIHESSGLA
jgi:hypothetical protein